VSGRRIVVIDVLRGVCFVFMTADHLPGNPLSRFSNPMYGPLGFFTAALGFVFLSGLVAGFVYEDHRIRHGFRAMTRRVAGRIRALYVTQLALIGILLVAVVGDVPHADRWHLDLFVSNPWRGLFFGVALLYEPGYLGILPMYCLFLVLTPFLLWQFARRRVWYVLCLSSAIWVVSGMVVRLPTDSHGLDFGAFNPLSYQFLFIAGLALGTRRVRLELLADGVQRWVLGAAFAVAVISLALRQEYAVQGPVNPFFDQLGSAVELGPLRLLDFAAFALIVYWALRTTRWSGAGGFPFRWLAFVGQHSLPVFAWSILVAYAAVVVYPTERSLALGGAALLLATVSLTLPAQARATYVRRRESRRAGSASPDPSAQVAAGGAGNRTHDSLAGPAVLTTGPAGRSRIPSDARFDEYDGRVSARAT